MMAPTPTNEYPSLCILCTSDAVMLTGYCLTGVKCDRCGRVTDCAMCSTRAGLERLKLLKLKGEVSILEERMNNIMRKWQEPEGEKKS